MPLLRKTTWVLLSLLVLAMFPWRVAVADGPGPIIPPGFALVDSAPGVELYRKNYPGGNPDYVQVIDLSQGARLEPLHGAITDPRTGKGVYGGNDARFRSQSLEGYWQDFASSHPSAFCVVNGQFFYMKEYPTRLPFPLKIDGQVVTDGYGINQFPDHKLMLELWPGSADITELTQEALYSTSAPDVIAGLTADASKQKKRFTGRTFVGVDDRDGDGQFETVLIYATLTATQFQAEDVVRSFGADRMMMLDGGGSTQLDCQGRSYIASERLIPQAIGVVAASEDSTGPSEKEVAASSGKAAAPGAQLLAAVAAAAQPAPTQAEQAATASEPQAAQPVQATQEPAPTAMPEPAAAPAENQVAVQEKQDAVQATATVANTGSQELSRPEPTATPVVIQPTVAPQNQEPAKAQPLQPDAGQPAVEAQTQPQTQARRLQATQAESAVQSPAVIGMKTQPTALALALLQEQSVVENGRSSQGQAFTQAPQAVQVASLVPIQLDDALWVPLVMSPVILILFFIISRIRHL